MTREPDLIVVGGGLAGLTAAALAGQQGRSVVVIEQASRLGGRAVTHDRNDVLFNLGPHALYCKGHAFSLLRELNVPVRGRFPNPGRSRLTLGERDFAPPEGPLSLLTSRLLRWREKLRLANLLKALPSFDTAPLQYVSLEDWLTSEFGSGGLALLLRAFFRVTTYGNDPRRMSAGAAIDQLRTGLQGNVWYLDGGWQTLIDGLRDRAVELGAEVRHGARATSIQSDQDGVLVRLAGGEELRASAAIIAASPKVAIDLLDLPHDDPLVRWASGAIPVRAATLDVALTRLPQARDRFALGLDQPLYFSVHSAAARLAPPGIAVLHVMKYLGSGPAEPAAQVEQELEAYLDRLQPGWRQYVITRRFLPGLTVTHSLPRADEGGLAGRPGPMVADRPNVFLAGDWVGREGMLADASAASAAAAVRFARAAIDRSLTHA